MMLSMTRSILLGLAVLCFVGFTARLLCASNRAESGIGSERAIQYLKEGNQRFVEGKRIYPHLSSDRIQDVTKEQHPYVTVISCSDSRVPPEHLFDIGIGDLFSIRVAGNVCDTDEIGSIEYGVDHLGTPLLVVLGHSSCGAVSAVVRNEDVHGSIPELVDNIVPAVERVRRDRPDLQGDELIAASVKSNIWQSVEDLLSRSEATRGRLKAGTLKIVGAVYHLDEGRVEWLGSHPREKEILDASEKKSHSRQFVHSVYFYLDENASQDRIDRLIGDCKTLLGSVKTVRKVIVGVPAGTPRDVVDNAYGVSLIVFFDSKEGHDYYQTAQEHLKFIERNKSTWKRVQIYDAVPK